MVNQLKKIILFLILTISIVLTISNSLRADEGKFKSMIGRFFTKKVAVSSNCQETVRPSIATKKDVNVNENIPACSCRRAQGFERGWCSVAGGGVPGCDH